VLDRNRLEEAMRVSIRIVAAAALLSLATSSALAGSTAFRITALYLRDPHLFVNFIGCRDLTDTPLAGVSVNGDLQTRLQTDADSDGLLDLNDILVFDPLDQTGPGGPARFGRSSCTAPPASSTCGPTPTETLDPLVTTNSSSTLCLGIIPGTTHGYSPAVATPTAGCFVSDELSGFQIGLLGGGVPLTLRNVRIGAVYSGSPATGLVNGLIRGFLSKADADATVIPNSVPLVGGLLLSSLLPGGSACCAAFSDLDTGPAGEQGWWFYLNFVASHVTYTGPSLGVGDASGLRLVVSSPNPARGAVALAYRLDADGPASITVHDLAGRLVARPASGWQSAGTHTLVWPGRLDGGGDAPPGLYVIRLSSPRGTLASKIVLLR
jgi:hypothetical protein